MGTTFGVGKSFKAVGTRNSSPHSLIWPLPAFPPRKLDQCVYTSAVGTPSGSESGEASSRKSSGGRFCFATFSRTFSRRPESC